MIHSLLSFLKSLAFPVWPFLVYIPEKNWECLVMVLLLQEGPERPWGAWRDLVFIQPASQPIGDLCFIIDKQRNKKGLFENDFSQLNWHIHLAKNQRIKEKTFKKHYYFMTAFLLHLLFYFLFYFDRILGCVLKKPTGLRPICMFKIMHCQFLLWCPFLELLFRGLTTLKEVVCSFNLKNIFFKFSHWFGERINRTFT